MSLNLRFIDADVEEHGKVRTLLHAKFDPWAERVDLVLLQAPGGWVVARATATLSSGPDGTGLTTETSRFVFHEVRAVLEDAGEALAPA